MPCRTARSAWTVAPCVAPSAATAGSRKARSLPARNRPRDRIRLSWPRGFQTRRHHTLTLPPLPSLPLRRRRLPLRRYRIIRSPRGLARRHNRQGKPSAFRAAPLLQRRHRPRRKTRSPRNRRQTPLLLRQQRLLAAPGRRRASTTTRRPFIMRTKALPASISLRLSARAAIGRVSRVSARHSSL